MLTCQSMQQFLNALLHHQLEYNTLEETGTFEIVDLPTNQKAIGSGWVFQVKHIADGSIERLKARIVAKG